MQLADPIGKYKHCHDSNYYFSIPISDQPLCSHMTAPSYFAESINSDLGFWGIRCKNYFDYLIGRCGRRDKNAADEEDDDEDSDEVEKDRRLESKGEEDLINVMPRYRSGKFDWQLMGEHCNET